MEEADIEVSFAISMTDDEYMSVVEGIGVTITVIDASIVVDIGGGGGGGNVSVFEAEV